MRRFTVFALLAMVAVSASATDWNRGVAFGGKVRFAPDANAEGYYPIVDVCPAPIDDAHMIAVDYWTNINERCVCVYKQVPLPPPPPRTFSKMKAVIVLTEAGVWEGVKAWITTNGLYDIYLAAQSFREDDPYFRQGLATLQRQLGWSDEAVEAVLSRCEAGAE